MAELRPTATDLTGLILAGGRGSRMGGLDKGLVAWQGEPLVRHVAARLAPQVNHLLVSANRNAARYAELGFDVLADADPDAFEGPLAGMLAGLEAATTPWLLTAPCDSPNLPTDLGARLIRGVQDAGKPLAMAQVCGQYEPVFCLLSIRLAPSLRAYLAAGERKIDRWVLSEGGIGVAFDDEPAAFANANTVAELSALLPAGRVNPSRSDRS